jgi:phosphoglycerate dehydrogenase-like enzyme
VATKIVFASRLPAAIVDTARAMVPAGFEMTAVDHGTPAFYEALHDAEFYLGFPRPGMGNEFFRAAPRLRLVQLVTAGYDTLDLEAARKAGVPVANCGGSNAVSVAEHTITLMLAVLKRLVWQHNNVVAGKWRVGDFAQTRCYEVEGKVLGLVGLGNRKTRSASASCCSASSWLRRTWSRSTSRSTRPRAISCRRASSA